MKDLKNTLELFAGAIKNANTLKPSKKLETAEVAQELLEAADAGDLDFDTTPFTELTVEDQRYIIVLAALGCIALSAL